MQAVDRPLLGLQKRYADDEDFQLTPAQAAQLMAQQAAELEDTDMLPAEVPLPPAALQTTPVHPAPERQAPHSVPAAAVLPALHTSASLPAAEAASAPAATAQGNAAESGAPLKPAAPALRQAASLPVAKPAQTALTGSAAKVVSISGDVLPHQVKHVSLSPGQRPSQGLHSTATTSAAAGGPSKDESGGKSQKSGSKVWRPPAALASPQRSSGEPTQHSGCKTALKQARVLLPDDWKGVANLPGHGQADLQQWV